MTRLKNGKKPKASKKKSAGRRVQTGMRSQATRVLAQGVGALPRRAFGAAKRSHTLACWDAKLPHHLPLPRAVGPYTVVRTTKRFQANWGNIILGTFMKPTGSSGSEWTNICAVAPSLANGDANWISAHQNTNAYRTPLDFLARNTSMATCVPSAFTVQILNPEALQTTTGIVYAGVMNT